MNEILERVFRHIEESAKGSSSESSFAGLFDDYDVNSNKLGNFTYLFDVVEMNRGARVVRAQLSDSTGYPVYQNSLMSMGYYENSNCEGHTTFVIAAGAAGEAVHILSG